MIRRDAWLFLVIMCCIQGVALACVAAMFGGVAAFATFWLMGFAFSTGAIWDSLTSERS